MNPPSQDKAAGKTQKDLPMLPKYVHLTGRPFLCWSRVLGKCGYRDCRFCKEDGHPLLGDITEEFADQVIDVIGKGVVSPSIEGGSSLPKSIKETEPSTDSASPKNEAKGSEVRGWSAYTWRNRRLPSPTRINSSVCPSVCMYVRPYGPAD